MHLFKNINYLFIKSEKQKLWIIFFGILLCTILETVSIASIIPVFNVIVLEKIPLNNFFNLSNVKFDLTFKITVIFIFVLIFFIKNLFIILFNFFFINFIYKLNINISKRLFYLCLNQDYIFFAKGRSNNFLQKITDDVSSTNSFLISGVNFLIEIIFILSISTFLIFINYKIFLFCFFIFFTILCIYYNFFKKRINRWSISNRDSSGKIKNLVIEGINGIKDIIVYKLEDYFLKSFNTNTILANQSRSKIDFLNNVQKYWLELVTVFALSVALIYFVLSSYDINKLIPIFSVFVFALFRLLSSFNRIVLHGQNIKFNYVSYISLTNQFKEFYSQKIEDLKNEDFKFDRKIEFKDVTFFYANSSNKIINNVNLEIKKGDCIGIVGNNGSGKSTFLNLISGLLEPTSGNILIDDKFCLYANKKTWTNKISYVQQNIFLLDSTIKHNISLVDENDLDRLRLNKIINDLNLDIFFHNFPNKLETLVGNNGLNLSGGQKQIISLARALYKNSEIIILDEPSSALDLSNTSILKNIILTLKGFKTIIMVTHEKEYFKDCFDKILKFNSGNVE